MLGAAPKITDAWELAKQYKVQDLGERVIKEVSPSPSCWWPAIEFLVFTPPLHVIGASTSGYRK